MWPILYGVSGILPFGWASARPSRAGPPTSGTLAAVAAAPTVTPRLLRKSRRETSGAMERPSFVGWTVSRPSGGTRIIAGVGAKSRCKREARPVFGAARHGRISRNAAPAPIMGPARAREMSAFTVNPWLPGLPDYLVSGRGSLGERLAKTWDLVLFWFSADGSFGIDWGFAVTTAD